MEYGDMTRIDFYLLDHAAVSENRGMAVCKLASKAFRLGHQIYIFTDNQEESQHLDRMLWTFQPGSFIPHELKSDNMSGAAPVLIGHDDPPEDRDDVLICLRPQITSCFSRFERVAEVVGTTEEEKRLARERYRFYRDRGYQLQTHNL